jgi:hypothetical protein
MHDDDAKRWRENHYYLFHLGGIDVELLQGFSTRMCYSWNKAGSTFVNVMPGTASE